MALYLTDLARTHKVSTLYRRLSGVSQAHQAAGFFTPTTDAQVRLVFQGIRRTLGSAPDQKNAANTADVRAMVETLLSTALLGVRDRALLLVGFAGAFRRSELVSLDVADVTFGADGLIVRLRRSKTDQEGEGRKVGLPFGSSPLTCPVRLLRAWLDVAAITQGPIFRPVDRHANIADTRLTDQSVALVVKRCAKAAGLDPEKYAGHSLRSGLATAAAMADVSERAIMARPGTSPYQWSVAASAMVRCSGATPPPRLVCDVPDFGRSTAMNCVASGPADAHGVTNRAALFRRLSRDCAPLMWPTRTRALMAYF